MLERRVTVSIAVLCALLCFRVQVGFSAQANPAPEGFSAGTTASKLSSACRAHKGSDQLSSLLQAIEVHPTAEGYENLGVLYSRAGEPQCTIAAFEAALAIAPGASQVRYDLALALITDHRPDPAAAELRLLIRQEPGSFKAHNALGLALQDLGHLEGAAAEFKAALELNPHFALATYDLAQLQSSQKHYQAAIYYLKQGIANAPPAELALDMKNALAVAYAQLENYADAIPFFRELAASRPNSPESHFNLATAYAHREDYSDAVTEYKEVLRLDPNHSLAELSLAKALMNLSAVEEALPYLENYVRRNPSDPQGLEILGGALKISERLNESTEVLKRAVRLNPSSYKAHCDLGIVFNRTGHINDAIQELQTAINLKPDGREARYHLGLIFSKAKKESAAREQFAALEQLKQNADRESQAASLVTQANDLLQKGLTKEAIAAYRKALLLQPGDAKLHYNLAVALSKLGDRGGEERELLRAVELDPKLPQAHNQLGYSFMLQQRFVDAEREFKLAIQSNPQYAEALNNLGVLFGHQSRNAEAETLFREALAVDPQYAQAFINLGLSLAATGNYTSAEQQFRSALNLEPNNANALTALGMLQGKTGRDADAVETFRKLITLNPASADAHVNLGIALGDLYDLQSALTEFSEAIRLASNFAVAHFNKGRVLYALGRMDEARQELDTAVQLSPTYVDALFLLGVLQHSPPRSAEIFQKVVNLQPGNSQARFHLGRSLLQLGKKDEAVAEWKKAVQADPENFSAIYNLARTLNQLRKPEAAEYMARLQALEERRQLTDRVQQLNNFALQAAKDNSWQQALGQLQEAIDLCQQCAQLAILRKNLGLIYAQKGDLENAKKQLELAAPLLPAGPDAVAVAQLLRRLGSSSPALPQNQ